MRLKKRALPFGHPGIGHPAFGHAAFGHAAFGHPAFGHLVFELDEPDVSYSCATSSTGQTVVGYHATSARAAASIRAGGFRCGSVGLAGGGIYFATSEHDASRKSNHGNDVVLMCQLTLGRTLTLDQHGDQSMTLQKLNARGYDSVKILRNGASTWSTSRCACGCCAEHRAPDGRRGCARARRLG